MWIRNRHDALGSEISAHPSLGKDPDRDPGRYQPTTSELTEWIGAQGTMIPVGSLVRAVGPSCQ